VSAWYLAQNGQQQGPFSAEQIAALARDGSLTDQVYLAGPGLAGWTVASQVPLVQQARMGGGPLPFMGHGTLAGQPVPFGGSPAVPPVAGGGGGQAPMLAVGGAGMAGPMGDPTMAGMARAATHAKGNWAHERLKGLGAIALGLLIAVLNVVSIAMSETFYPKSVIAAFGAFFYGGWVVVFGDEFDDETMELVRWKQIGMYGSGALGVLLGIVISIAIAD
jgi:hypothetical protein